MKTAHVKTVEWHFEVKPEEGEWPDFKRHYGSYILRPVRVHWHRYTDHSGKLQRSTVVVDGARVLKDGGP
jgi:hypothetical protein